MKTIVVMIPMALLIACGGGGGGYSGSIPEPTITFSESSNVRTESAPDGEGQEVTAEAEEQHLSFGDWLNDKDEEGEFAYKNENEILGRYPGLANDVNRTKPSADATYSGNYLLWESGTKIDTAMHDELTASLDVNNSEIEFTFMNFIEKALHGYSVDSFDYYQYNLENPKRPYTMHTDAKDIIGDISSTDGHLKITAEIQNDGKIIARKDVGLSKMKDYGLSRWGPLPSELEANFYGEYHNRIHGIVKVDDSQALFGVGKD